MADELEPKLDTVPPSNAGARCKVRLMRPGEEAAVVELVTESYPTWPKIESDVSPIEHWRWKISEPNEVNVVVGEIDGRLAGMSTRALRPLKLGDTEILMQLGFDSCVRQEYRSARVMSSIRAAFVDLLPSRGDLMMFVTDHPAYARIRESEGATSLNRPVHALQCAAPFNSERRHADAHWRIALRENFDERVDSFWRETAKQFDLISVRSAKWLNWRFADRRAGEWTIKTAEEGATLLGYAVYRVTGGAGQIADILALPGHSDVVEGLIADALVDFQERGAAHARCWCPTLHPYRPQLASLGFSSKRKTLHLDWVAFTSKVDRAVFENPRMVVHYMSGDTDLV